MAAGEGYPGWVPKPCLHCVYILSCDCDCTLRTETKSVGIGVLLFSLTMTHFFICNLRTFKNSR